MRFKILAAMFVDTLSLWPLRIHFMLILRLWIIDRHVC